MPPPVYSRVAIRIGFGRLPPAGAREGKDHGDPDAHCARYQETRPAGAVACADSAASSRGSRDGRDSHADMEDCSPKPKADRGYGVVGTFHGVELVVVRAARDADHGQQASGGHAELLTGLFDEDGLPAAGQVFRDCARLFPQQLQRPTADRDLDVRFPLLPPLPLDVGVQLVQAGPCPRRPLLRRRLFVFN